jgi:hypothetical protein
MLVRTSFVVRRFTPSIYALCLLSFVRFAVACVDAQEAVSPWESWDTLRLKARSAPLMRGSVELRVSEGAEGRRLETSTRASFLGATIARSQTTTLLDATTGRPKESHSYTKKKGRRYVFGPSGYTVEKLRPTRSDDGDEAWEVTTTREFTYSEDDATTPLFDYYGMLLHLGDLGLDTPGDEVTLRVATSKGPQAYRLSVSDMRTGERVFTDLTTGEKTTLPTREFRLAVVPADPESEEGFLKMEGEIEIWVEAETGTLLEIVGKVPKIPGKVKLVLAELG